MNTGGIGSNGQRLSRAEMSPRSGCLAKLRGCDLQELLVSTVKSFRESHQSSGDLEMTDCAPFHINPPLLGTTDIGPLIGCDLVCAGRVAALHAMSDIFASGGVPKWALITLICNPDYPLNFAEAVLQGICFECSQEEVTILGGHTCVGPEAMAGLTIIGAPKTNTLLRKRGAQPGDTILLSKPLGVGLVVHAFRVGLVGEKELNEAMAVMLTSNRTASSVALEAHAHAATDVTGFGLLGHLSEMLGNNLGAELDMDAIPIVPVAATLPSMLGNTYWSCGNRDYATRNTPLTGRVGESNLEVLFDPQTNGGLLVVAGPEDAITMTRQGFSIIGRINSKPGIQLI